MVSGDLNVCIVMISNMHWAQQRPFEAVGYDSAFFEAVTGGVE